MLSKMNGFEAIYLYAGLCSNPVKNNRCELANIPSTKIICRGNIHKL